MTTAVDRTSSPIEIRSLEGASIHLRPVAESDMALLYSWRDELVSRRQWIDVTPSVEYAAFREEVRKWLRGTITLLVVSNTSGKVVGFWRAYNLNLVDGWVWLQTYASHEYRFRLGGVEAAFLFHRNLYSSFPIRKTYSEIAESNHALIAVLQRLGCAEECRLRNYIKRNEGFEDLIILSGSRSNFTRMTKLWSTLAGSSRYQAKFQRMLTTLADVPS